MVAEDLKNFHCRDEVITSHRALNVALSGRFDVLEQLISLREQNKCNCQDGKVNLRGKSTRFKINDCSSTLSVELGQKQLS
mmetsp:Transcript_18186/g.37980  ORF Transcript_18186/g.37980 Transcript_18186/m.37980 type:complete len:81 (+) Transcript_18186:23-265(+)